MAGAVETAGETAKTFFSTMKEAPLALALVVALFALIALLFVQGHDFVTQRTETVGKIIDWQKEVQGALVSCIPVRDIPEMARTFRQGALDQPMKHVEVTVEPLKPLDADHTD